MPVPRATSRTWIPVLLWMALIFVGSTDVLSSRNTSRWITATLRWIKPDVSRAAIQRVQLIVRKAGHVTEYAVLAILIWRASRGSTPSPASSLTWRTAFLVWLPAVLYAASDEFHQSFVASRQGSALDVCIDGLGAALGLVLVCCWSRRTGRGPLRE